MLQKIEQELEQGKTLLTFILLQGVGQALGMIAPLVIAKSFSPELFGSYSLAKMIVFFFSTLLIASSQAPFIVFASRERMQSGKINKAFSVQCLFLLSSFCVFAGTVLVFNGHITTFAKISRGDLFFVLLAFVGLATKSFLSNLFMAMGHRIKNSFAELVFGGLTFFFVLVLCMTHTINLRAVFLIYFISAIIVVLVFIKTIDFDQLFPLVVDSRCLKGMFSFARWTMLGATAVYFINWGDNLVLRFYVSMEEVGTYNFAYQIFKGVLTLAFTVYAYFLPFVSQHIANAAKIKDFLSNKRPKIFLLGFLVIGVIFVFAPRIIKAVFGDAYSGSCTILRILLVGSVAKLYTSFYYLLLQSLKKYKVAQTVNFLQVLVNLLLDLVLVPIMGLLGAAVATVVAYLFRAVVFEVYFIVKARRLLGL